MRRRKVRLATAASAVLAVIAGLLVAPAVPARAETVPSLKYPAVSLTPGLPYPMRVLSQKDGGVVLGACGDSQDAVGFRQYNASGTAVQSQPPVSGGNNVYTCTNQSAVGADGTLYTVVVSTTAPYQNKLIAYKNSTRQWTYTPPCETISAVEIGTNGNVYMLVNWSGTCGFSSTRLIGIAPTLAAGQTVPAAVANTEIEQPVVANGGLSPYGGGLVVRFQNGAGFYTYSGTQQKTYTLPTGAYDGGPFATVDGWAILPILDQTPRPTNCTDDTQAAQAIAAYSANGIVWTHQLPQCSRVNAIRPLPDGGAVALVQDQDDVDWTQYTRHFVGVAPATTQQRRWEGAQIPAFGSWQGDVQYLNFSYVTDLNGNLVVQSELRRHNQSDNNDYREAYVATFSGSTGISFGNAKFAGGPDDGYGFGIPSPGELPAIADGVVFLPLSQCGYGCDYTTTKLYAAKVPGMAMDYPRGAVLRYNEPWKNYVAMGDSFSSGEGVEPFIAGTDTAGPPANGCHRSERAYAKLLGGKPGLRWQNPLFVACSGATTQNITNSGQYNENKQIDALDSTTDIVTLTIGGNDIGFGDYATACFNPADDCAAAPYITIKSKIENNLPAALNNTFNAIKSKIGPQTKVLVIGYPMMVSEVSVNTYVACPYLWPDEKTATRDVITRLNLALKTAVQAVNNVQANPQFRYIDATAQGNPFTGHEVCVPGGYFNNIVSPPNQEYSLHPNAAGQAAYGRLIMVNI